MSEKIVIYQKPTCSKCRSTLALLSESGKEFQSVNYYETPLTAEQLRELVRKLNVSVRDILRNDEPAARGLENAMDEDIIQAMISNPDLIQRPIVVRGDQAKLCRPPENVLELLRQD